MSKIIDSKRDNFNSKLSFELLTKYLPKFDIFCDSILVNQIISQEDSDIDEGADKDEDKNSHLVIVNSFDMFSLYFDIFMTRGEKKILN